MATFDELVYAFEWVSADPTGENSAYVNRSTGQVYWDTDAVESDEEFPEDIEDGTKYIAVPHKRDLDLGLNLVMRFVENNIPQEAQRISAFFRSPGAYGKYKRLLEQRGLLDAWHEYENNETTIALRSWAADHSLPY